MGYDFHSGCHGVPYIIDKENKQFRFDPLACVGKLAKGIFKEGTGQFTGNVKVNKVIGPEETVEGLEGTPEAAPGEGDSPF